MLGAWKTPEHKNNSLTKNFTSLKISQIHSTLEINGQNVNLSLKSEIKLIVDHVGLMELLKPCLIEFVLHLDKLYKLEFLLKI